MESIWGRSVCHSLDEALEMLAATVRDCPNDLWQTPMWTVDPPEMAVEVYDVDDRPVTDPAQRSTLVQRWSTPWSVAWHALEVLDYDLTGELDAWAPPPPFTDKPHWRTFTSLPVPWTPVEIGAYVDYCRRRVHDTLSGMTEDEAATLLPAAHRYQGTSYAGNVTSLIGHTTAHATQIRQSSMADALDPRLLGDRR
jgi:hypothetical protein